MRMQNPACISKIAVKEEFLSAHRTVRLGQLGFYPLHETVGVKNVHARSLTDLEVLREFLKTYAADIVILVFLGILAHHRFAQIRWYIDEFGHHL